MNQQRGAALLLFFLVILFTSMIFVVSNITDDRFAVENESITTQSLAEARQALIAYAVTYYDMHSSSGEPKAGLMGFLPCPDDGSNEGQSSINCGSKYISRMGRLPWKKLGIQPLKDGSGNCLWYVVSSEYKDIGAIDRDVLSNAAGLTRTEMLNDDSNGSFRLFDKTGNLIKGSNADERLVALIIAPGKELPTQNRSYDPGTQCGNDYDAQQFLETINGINNADITITVDALDDFIGSYRTNDNAFNDRIIGITQSEIFDAIKQRSNFSGIIHSTTRSLAECLAEFALSNPQPAGACDAACVLQCNADRQICYDCRNQCAGDRDACIAAGERPSVCNQIRNNCNRSCLSRNACDSAYSACIAGGSGGNNFRLPWPAPMLLTDYRDSQLYVEDTVSSNHLGRLAVDIGNPLNIDNTLTRTGNPGNQYLLESDFTGINPLYVNCQYFNANALGTYNSVERRFWENWKDHFFYAVAGDYASNAANNPTPTLGNCVNCLSVNGTGNYSAVVFFSGERLAGQLRTVSPPDVLDTRQDITNYLEGSNATNFTGPENINGNGNYQTSTGNDIAYCIEEILDITTVDPLDTTLRVIECP